MFSIGYFFNKNNITLNNTEVPVIVDNNIEHGVDKTILTLDDDTEIFLESGDNN